MGFFRKKILLLNQKEDEYEEAPKKASKKSKGKRASKFIDIFDAKPEHCFWVNEGGVLRNLRDLQDALVAMSDDQFKYHTKREGNDFATWIDNVFHEKELANKIDKAKTRKGALLALKQYIG
jgi:hypothetical protein